MNTLVYMTTRIIEAYECICDKCGYKWSSISLPATCANKTCRTPRWNRELQAEKKSVEASPIEEQKLSHHDYVRKALNPAHEALRRQTIAELQAVIQATPARKSVLPEYPKQTTVDQPDYYENERFIE